jgi:putative FmdB family regulatory protein
MEEEVNYLCSRCGKVFRLADSEVEQAMQCPYCKDNNIKKLPYWAPAGSDVVEDKPVWEYQCQLCQHTFKLPIPGSPSEEKGIKCPACGGGHIHRLTSVGGEPLYCG